MYCLNNFPNFLRRSGIKCMDWEKSVRYFIVYYLFWSNFRWYISAARSKTKIFVLGEINIWAAKSCVIWWSNLQKSFWFGKSFDNLDNSDFVILFNLAKQRSEDESQLFLTGRKFFHSWHFKFQRREMLKPNIKRL